MSVEAKQKTIQQDKNHRLTLRIPKWLLEKLDEKRKGSLRETSRTLWILQLIEKATKK